MDNRNNQDNQNLENNNQQFNNQNLENNQQVNYQNNVQQQNYDQNNEEFEDFDNEKYFEENQYFEDEEQDAQDPKQNKNYGKLFLTVFAAFALGATSVFGAQAVTGTGSALRSSVTATKEDKDNQQLTVNAISKAKDAVVSVVTYQTNSNNLDSILGGNSKNKSNNKSNSSDSGDLKTASTGSGVIYKKTGNTAYVVTNNHVVKGAKKLAVILSDGTDVWTDLAVLKISGDNVTTTMDFANSDDIAVGETAFAIGSPLDVSFSNTVTKGIVSAVNRQIPMDVDGDGTVDWNQTVIQTDAAINPGNSGGALINNEGKLIGINESKIAKATSSVSAEGIGFGIPSNEVKLITEQLEKSGKVVRPAMGVQLVSVNTIANDTVKSELKYEGKQGVVVRLVESGTPAAKAGLEKYDVITKLNDTEVKDVAAVRKFLFEKTKIGDTVKVTYYRGGQEKTTEIVVQAVSNT